MYIDLATAGTVGANTLVGGLYKADLLTPWTAGKLGLVIDALDEARMVVTDASFLDFLSEIVSLASTASDAPRIVLFGRTGAIDDAGFWLEASGLQKGQVGVMEIGFYGPEKSEEFAGSVLEAIRAQRHGTVAGDVEQRAIRLILDRLRLQTGSEGQRFAGYAPVLRAVAERVADETGNTQRFVNEIEANPQVSPITLYGITNGILEREQGKVRVLKGDLPETLLKQLYTPHEQLDRLSEVLYSTPPSPLPPNMTPNEISVYDAALNKWMQEHPFLDGKGAASCAVFEAHVCVHALRVHRSATALSRQLGLGRKANPFLSELYCTVAGRSKRVLEQFPAEHVGIMYASIRSRLARGEWASLEVSAVEFEITIGRKDEEEILLHEGIIDTGTSIKFGPDLEDVNIDADSELDVELGCASTYVNIVTPVSIRCRNLLIHAQHMAVSGQLEKENETELAYLGAAEFISDIQKAPLVHGRATLEVDWNWGHKKYPYPWTGYEAGTGAVPIADLIVEDIHRKLIKFVVVCKAGAGGVGRHAKKFENKRMKRGWGGKVLGALVEEGVFKKVGQFYYLDPSRLSEVTGLTYRDCRRGQNTVASVGFATRVRGADHQ